MNAMSKDALAAAGALIVTASLIAAPTQAQTFKTLHGFCATTSSGVCSDGANPAAGLVQATNGNLYGTTQYGGPNNAGTAFRISPVGKLTTVHTFCLSTPCADGAEPRSGLMQDSNGDLYGATYSGGVILGQAFNEGVVFKMTLGGTLTPLDTLDINDGATPVAVLVQGATGDLYGTTGQGGENSAGESTDGGTVYKMTAGGALTTIHSFCLTTNSSGYCTDGSGPTAGVIQASNGDLYGTTESGGANDGGTVYKITPGGKLTTLYSFCSQTDCTDGNWPSVLVQAADGNLYGTTAYGGNGTNDGTVFKITPSGEMTTLYRFCSLENCTDGVLPLYAGLIQGTDGNLYGTTNSGGTNYGGTIFKITTAGTLTTLYNFCSQSGCADGIQPQAALIQGTNGDFYGTTNSGAYGYGTVFSLSTGLAPFVALQTSYGTIGAEVIILGTDFTGATAVNFNGTAATYAIVSKSEIKATVPNGATTGTVVVTTPGGELISNQSYTVKP